MLSHAHAASTRREIPALYLAFALLVIAIVIMHTVQFAGRLYRQDEAWVVHTAIENLSRESLPSLLARNVTQFATENAVLEIWIALFGHLEPITRYLSTLWTALGLALLFRLGSDLFDRRVALIAIFILGMSGFYASHTHETRPYAMLIMSTVGLQLVFLRWIERPRLSIAILYGLFAVGAFYAHLFIVYVIAAQVIFFALFVRLNRTLYLKTLALFAITGILMLPRLFAALDFYLRIFPGGIFYAIPTDESGILQLYHELQYGFEPLALFLQLAGLVIPLALAYPALRQRPFAGKTHSGGTSPIWRLDPGWRRGYAIVLPLAIVLVGLAVNVFMKNVTARNLVIVLPSVALVMALGLRALRPTRLRPLALLLMIPAGLVSMTAFSPNLVEQNHPILEEASILSFMSPDFQAGDRVVLELGFIVQQVPTTYYVRERLPFRVPNEDVFHIMRPRQADSYIYSTDGPGVPDRPVHLATDTEDLALGLFHDFVVSAGPRLWYVGDDDGVFGTPVFRQIIEQYYREIGVSGLFREYERIEENGEGS